MTEEQIIDRVARAIHAADKTHGHEPYEPNAETYRDMAFAAMEEYDAAKEEQQ